MRSGPLPDLAFAERKTALRETGLHATSCHESCGCCGRLIVLLEVAGQLWWVDIVPVWGALGAVSLAWVDHDGERCACVRAQRRAADRVKSGGRAA